MSRYWDELKLVVEALVRVRNALPSSTVASMFASESTFTTWPRIEPDLLADCQKLSQTFPITYWLDLLEATRKSASSHMAAPPDQLYHEFEFESEYLSPTVEAIKANGNRSESSANHLYNKDGKLGPCLVLVLTGGLWTRMPDDPLMRTAIHTAEQKSGHILRAHRDATSNQVGISFISSGNDESVHLRYLARLCIFLAENGSGPIANKLSADKSILKMLLGPKAFSEAMFPTSGRYNAKHSRDEERVYHSPRPDDRAKEPTRSHDDSIFRTQNPTPSYADGLRYRT